MNINIKVRCLEIQELLSAHWRLAQNASDDERQISWQEQSAYWHSVMLSMLMDE